MKWTYEDRYIGHIPAPPPPSPSPTAPETAEEVPEIDASIS
jgi:hypothetical protein